MKNKLPQNNILNNINNNWLKVGKIGRPFGIKGFVKIQSFTTPEVNIIQYLPWYDKDKKSYKLLETQQLGNKIIALFDPSDKPETNAEIWIERSQLPQLKKDEYYWTDLIGLKAYNLQDKYLGDITDLLRTGANDVLIIKNNFKNNHKKSEILIPYVLHKYIIKIDLDHKIITVDWEWEDE